MRKAYTRIFFLFVLLPFFIFSQEGFKIVTYNILNEAFMDPKFYPHLDVEKIDHEKRKKQILEQILTFDADIICLQEVDTKMYEYLSQELSFLGYRGQRCQKLSSFDDSIVTFSKEGNLRFLRHEPHFCINPENPSLKSQPPALVSYYCNQNNQIIIVINTKFKWQKSYVKTHDDNAWNQLKYLLETIVKNNKGAEFVILGDFNFTPSNIIYQELERAGFLDVEKPFNTATCMANGEWKRIDFIFYLGSLQSRSFLEKRGGLEAIPNDSIPSDHLPVCAIFEECYESSGRR